MSIEYIGAKQPLEFSEDDFMSAMLDVFGGISLEKLKPGDSEGSSVVVKKTGCVSYFGVNLLTACGNRVFLNKSEFMVFAISIIAEVAYMRDLPEIISPAPVDVFGEDFTQ